jgi:hypothetical protein
MFKYQIRLLLIFTLFFIHNNIFFPQDKTMQFSVKETMQIIDLTFNTIKEFTDKENFYFTAVKLMDLAKLFKNIENLPPENSSKKDWIEIEKQIISNCFMAIGACGDNDKKEIEKYLEKILLLKQQAHGIFKK